MAADRQEILNQFSLKRIIWPILIGVAVLVYTIYQISREPIDLDAILAQSPLPTILTWLAVGLMVMMLRDFGYIWRMRILTEGKLSWRHAFEITLLWEFASALTPSVIGGSAVAIFMLIREKISAGRSTAIVFITIFLDELFYIIALPMALILAGHHEVFRVLIGSGNGRAFGAVVTSFWIAYAVLAGYTVFLAFALFIKPAATRSLLRWFVRLRPLKRWQLSGDKLAEDLYNSSHEFRIKSVGYWLQAGMATVLAWFGRYLVLNAVLSAFTSLSLADHVTAFARQAVMFVLMIVSPTPGASGIAEYVFGRLFSEFSPVGFVLILATVWRFISYYPYLLIGIPLLPIWLRRAFPPKPKKVAEPKV